MNKLSKIVSILSILGKWAGVAIIVLETIESLNEKLRAKFPELKTEEKTLKPTDNE